MDEEFLADFEQEKVTSWDSHYISYEKIIKEMTQLFNTKRRAKTTKETNIITNELYEKNDKIINEMKNRQSFKNNININQILDSTGNLKNDIDSSSTNKIKSFFDLLDKEIKKIYIFYSSKEKDIYQNINKRIQNKQNIKNKTCEEILKEMDDLEYLSNLCLELLEFIHLNIRALKNILSILDDILNYESQTISYNYLKKYLSKDNSDLIYILSFKILDETILAIQGLFSDFRNSIKNNEEFKNNNELKSEYKEHKTNISKNIDNFDETHEQIFSELTRWKKFLDVNLDLPSSSKNSIFEDTSFVGDYIENKTIKKSFKKAEKKKNDNNEKIFLEQDKNSLDIESLESFKRDISDIFSNQEDCISKDTKKLLSEENIKNINFFYILVFFYYYSYFVIISILSKFKGQDGDEKYYGLIISIPSLGSLISQQYIKQIIKFNFKFVLIKSLFFSFCHFILCAIGFYKNNIYLLLIARFLLGLSSLDRLCKIYIDQYIPISKQINSNKSYLIYIYVGCILGLILSDVEMIIDDIIYIIEKKIEHESEYEYLYIISCFIFSIVSIIIIKYFKNPTDDQFKMFNELSIKYNKENRLTTKFFDKNEKEIIEKQDNLFQNANSLTNLSGENSLSYYSNKIKKEKYSYFTKVFFLLILFLICSQYISESNLISILKLLHQYKPGEYFSSYYLKIILLPLAYVISFLLQKYFLKIIFFKKSSKKILLAILFVLIIFKMILLIFYLAEIDDKEEIHNRIRLFGIFFIIIISEFFRIVIINLFIGLLPSNEFKCLCLKQSNIINIIDKLSRLFPGTFYMIIDIFQFEMKKNFLCLLLPELFILIFSFIICFCQRHLLKSHSLTRIIYNNN